MKIIIVGAGVIGANLAKELSAEKHEVYLLEKDPDVARKVDEKLDAKVIVGEGADPASLKKAGIEGADLIIAVTTSDETNLVVCSLAAAYGTQKKIARVRSGALNQVLSDFGHERFYIDEITNPEELAAKAIVKAVKSPGARDVADFAGGRLLLRSFDIPQDSPLSGMTIGEFRQEDFPWPFLIIALRRNNDVFIPKGDTVLEAGDRIYTFLPAPSLGEFLAFINPAIRKPSKVIIYGATAMGEQVTRELSKVVREIIVLEEDKERAEEIAGRLDVEGARVINGSASETDILKECGVEVTDAFIATSHSDHSNLVSAVLAKRLGAKTTIITTQQPDYMAIVSALDIDVVINPRFLAVDQILRVVRGKAVSLLTKLVECDAEALELIPEPGSPVTKGPLKEVKFPKNSIVGAVFKESEVILADGDTQIKPGEAAIVFCKDDCVGQLQKLFTHKKVF